MICEGRTRLKQTNALSLLATLNIAKEIAREMWIMLFVLWLI